ncbi:unnamed protein product [Eruca vesicaria subsp. sativa]|uniref:ATP synthase F0 subunit 8 n=1 Tax=Eruca vesicaria subsp. sativa TaxID=29727 RepID=A0ABC8KXC6_ERUVS|nr:unnamed protein product [Eruca vesicaria subsp. sativa]
MGWLVKERRGGAWKRGWLEETLFTSSAPPLTLLTLFAIISLLLFVSSYPRYRSSYYVRANQAASVFEEGHFPWGILLMLVLILLLVSKQSYFHSLWYPTL